MVPPMVFALLLMAVFALLMARFSSPRHARLADPRPAMPPATLREVTLELLSAMGLSLREQPDVDTLLLTKSEPFGETRYVVMLAGETPVDQAAILEAAETLRGEGAGHGMLIATGELEMAGLAGLDVPLELIDGARFRSLVAQYLPDRLGTLDRYRGFGPAPELQPA